MFKGMFDGSSWAGILSTLIFFIVFVVAIILTILKKKDDVDYMANLPLDKDENLDHKN